MLQRLLYDYAIRVNPSDLGKQTIFPHNPLDFLVIHGDPEIFELHLNRSETELLFPFLKYCLNDDEVVMIPFGIICMGKPCVVAASGNVSDGA